MSFLKNENFVGIQDLVTITSHIAKFELKNEF